MLNRKYTLKTSLNAVVHLLHGLVLSQSQTSLVGNVVDTSLGFRMLSVDS